MSDIILPPKKNIIMDATLLSALMSCARYHDLRYNNNFISTKGKSNSLEVGSIVHKVMEVYYWHLIKGFNKVDAIGNGLTAGQLYITGCPHCSQIDNKTPECKHQPLEYPGVQNTPEENDAHLVGWKWALATCEQYFEFWKNDPWIPLFVETVKKKVLYEDEEIRILWKAKIDLGVDTNQGIYPTDHKTFKQNRSKTSLNNQFIGQCLVMETRGMMVNKIGFQVSKKPEEKFTREMVPYSKDRLEEWSDVILPYYAYKYAQYFESEYWPPNFTHCDTMYGPCIFKSICESDRVMREEVLRNEFMIGPKWDVNNVEGEE